MPFAEANKNRKKQQKLDYERSVLEAIGFQCQCGCGRKVGDFPRQRFQWDHVDPSTKIETVGHLKSDGFSVEQFRTEVNKCQFLFDQCHHKVTRAQNAGQIIDYRLPRLQRDWDMFPINDTGSARLNSLSDFKDPRGVEMYDHWIKLYPETIEWTFEEWCRQPVNRIMIEGVWVVTRDINGKLVSGHRISDGAEVEIHWRDGVRLRQTQQVH